MDVADALLLSDEQKFLRTGRQVGWRGGPAMSCSPAIFDVD